jgi:hypothetical protein
MTDGSPVPPRTIPETLDENLPHGSDELHKHNPGSVGYGIDPTDGIAGPMQQGPTGDGALAPPLTPENLICMEDATSFVVRDEWGAVQYEFPPEMIECTPNGRWRLRRGDEDKQGLIAEVVAYLGKNYYSLMRLDREVILALAVEPVRPACKYYHRYHIDLTGDPDRIFIGRVCTTKRGENGEYETVRDGCVYACSLREPRHLASEERMEKFDDKLIHLGRRREKKEEEFDVEAQLAAEGGRQGIHK